MSLYSYGNLVGGSKLVLKYKAGQGQVSLIFQSLKIFDSAFIPYIIACTIFLNILLAAVQNSLKLPKLGKYIKMSSFPGV